MLDFIYFPVSFILWCWHWVFGHLLGPANGVGWALSVVFLVFTVRLVLLKPAISQVRSMRKMQEFQPQIKKLQEKHKGDRQKLAAEMQKLQSEHGVNPLGGCLPLILQLPVFIGLNTVLRNFHPGGQSNYFFKAADVQSYIAANLFGARLSNYITEPAAELEKFVGVSRTSVILVAVPLMIAAAVATHFTARHSIDRQAAMGTAQTQQTAIMNKLTMWIFPLGVLTFGVAFPIGLLLYWLSNNAWTLAQQHFVYQQIDREEAGKKTVVQEQRQSLAPKPGQKPVADKKKRPAVDATATNGKAAAAPKTPTANGSTNGATNGSGVASAPSSDEADIPGMISSGSRKKPRKKQ